MATDATTSPKPNGKPEILRLLNGTRIESDSKDPKIIALLEMKAVIPADKYKPGMRATPKIVQAALAYPIEGGHQ